MNTSRTDKGAAFEQDNRERWRLKREKLVRDLQGQVDWLLELGFTPDDFARALPVGSYYARRVRTLQKELANE